MASDEKRIENINLVCEVEKYECIYDSTREDYCNRQLSDKTWIEIGNALGMTGTDARNRWANLRTVYVRRRSKKPKSGSEAAKPYYLDRYMQFLIPYLKLNARSTDSDFSPVPKNKQPEKKVFSDVELLVEQQEEVMDDEEDVIEDETTVSEYDVNPGEETFEPPLKRPSKRKSCMYFKSKGDVDKERMEHIATGRTQVKISGDPENPRRMFLLSLLPEVNELPENQFRTFKRKIFALLDEMEDSRSVTPTASSIPFPL